MSAVPINVIEKQAMIGSNLQQDHIPPTLRRTISADMSSGKWLSQNGMSPMRRISSSEELATTQSMEVDDQEELKQNMPTHDDVWRSIQSQKEKGSIWSSILSDKKDNDIGANNQTPPYVHPLLRKSASNLSQKSLEICTESLGSETGCEGFSACPASEITDHTENENEEKIEQKVESFEDFKVVKYNYNPSIKLKSPKKSFPPPLPSLHMQSQRKHGRLVLEAVSVPQQDYFHVDRQEGRLLLTLIDDEPEVLNNPKKLEAEVEDFEEAFDHCEKFDVHAMDEAIPFEDDEAKEKQGQMAIMVEKSSPSFPISGMINIPMMKSFMGMGKNSSLWSNKINKVVELMEAEKVVGNLTIFPQSLPPAASMGSFNVYEYFWRRNNKTSVAGRIDSSILTQQCSWKHNEDYNNDKVVLAKANQQELVIMRGNKGDYFVPLVCKESKRSLLVWKPHCIATS